MGEAVTRQEGRDAQGGRGTAPSLIVRLPLLLDGRLRATLSPNRSHRDWRPVERARKRVRAAAREAAWAALVEEWPELLRAVGDGAVRRAVPSVRAAYPGAPRTDRDNLEGGVLKPVRDGIADILFAPVAAASRDRSIEYGQHELRDVRRVTERRFEVDVRLDLVPSGPAPLRWSAGKTGTCTGAARRTGGPFPDVETASMLDVMMRGVRRP